SILPKRLAQNEQIVYAQQSPTGESFGIPRTDVSAKLHRPRLHKAEEVGARDVGLRFVGVVIGVVELRLVRQNSVNFCIPLLRHVENNVGSNMVVLDYLQRKPRSMGLLYLSLGITGFDL